MRIVDESMLGKGKSSRLSLVIRNVRAVKVAVFIVIYIHKRFNSRGVPAQKWIDRDFYIKSSYIK